VLKNVQAITKQNYAVQIKAKEMHNIEVIVNITSIQSWVQHKLSSAMKTLLQLCLSDHWYFTR